MRNVKGYNPNKRGLVDGPGGYFGGNPHGADVGFGPDQGPGGNTGGDANQGHEEGYRSSVTQAHTTPVSPETMRALAIRANTVRDSQGNPVTSEHGPVVGGTQVANAMRDYAQQQAVRSQAINNLPPSLRSNPTAISNEVNSMRDRLGELAAMKDKSNEDLNELGELNSLFGYDPTEDMGLTESLRYNVTNEDFKSDLSALAENPLMDILSLTSPIGWASNIYGALTNPVDTVTNAAQSVGDFFGNLDVRSAPIDAPGGGGGGGQTLPLYGDSYLPEETPIEEIPFEGYNPYYTEYATYANGGIASLPANFNPMTGANPFRMMMRGGRV